MANQDRVNFVWAESALTTIPPIPVSEVAYRDTTQTPEQMEVGQQYDTIYNSARHNQLLFLLTSVAKTLCENGIMPFLAGQEYSQYARCIFTDGKLYIASRAILANEQPYPTPGDDSGVWIAEETSENLVPNSRRVIAGTGLTGGGPLSSDVTLSAKLDGKTTQAAADGAITAKDVALGGDASNLASARGFFYDTRVPYYPGIDTSPVEDFDLLTLPGKYHIVVSRDTLNLPGVRLFTNSGTNDGILEITKVGTATTVSGYQRLQQRFTVLGTAGNTWRRYQDTNATKWFNWEQEIRSSDIGDGIRITNTKLSVPEYEGATASSAGTSGLVPPAAAGQQNHLLTGGGAYISKVPNATHADTADNSSALAGRSWLEKLYTDNPSWLIGSVDEKLRPINTGSLKVYAAATANTATGLTYAFTKNNSLVLPPGGTWFVLSWWDGDGGTAKGNWSGGQTVAGGSSVGVSNGAFALRVA